MKTVSLRAFRDSLGKVDPEAVPVEVVVRRDGYLITLGQWTPTGYLEPVRPFEALPKPVTQYAIDKAAGRLHIGEPEPRPFTPVPKPGKKG